MSSAPCRALAGAEWFPGGLGGLSGFGAAGQDLRDGVAILKAEGALGGVKCSGRAGRHDDVTPARLHDRGARWK